MNQTFATIVFGLAASLFWGSGDFSGGLASRRSNSTSVVVVAYMVGFALLFVLALIWQERFPAPTDLLWGGLGGVAGVIGLTAFYSALSSGRMGIVAPVSAVLTATLPVIFSAFTDKLPNPFQFVGFLLALLAIGLISRPPQGSQGKVEGIWQAVLAGCGFGCFFILISRVSHGAVFWPLAMARLTSVLFLLVLMLIRRQPILPGKKTAYLVVLAGMLDAIGNAFFILASHVGRLDVASILSSLYPVATVILATIILRERVTRLQAIGILFALVAIPLISVDMSIFQ